MRNAVRAPEARVQPQGRWHSSYPSPRGAPCPCLVQSMLLVVPARSELRLSASQPSPRWRRYCSISFEAFAMYSGGYTSILRSP